MSNLNPEEEFNHNYPERHADVLNAQQITISDIMDHMTGPVLSAVLHIVLLGLLGSIVVFKPPAEKKDIEVKVTELKIVPPEKIPEPPEPPEPVENPVDVKIDKPAVDVSADVETPVDNVTTTEDISDEIDIPDVMMIRPNNSAKRVSALFAWRGPKGGRIGKRRDGATHDTEDQVNKALKWLAEHQNSDGSWGEYTQQQPALTSLALLTFLAHGETPQSLKYGKTVYTAIRKCMEYASTGLGRKNGVIRNGGNGYGHAMVAYALSESYGMTKIPAIKKSMNQMVKTIVKGLNSMGSYNYNFNNAPQHSHGKVKFKPWEEGKPRCDLSIAGWNYQALKAGFVSGADVEGLEGAIEKSIEGIKKTHRTKTGGFSYGISRGASETMTSVGVLCLQLFGEKTAKETKAGLKLLEAWKSSKIKPLEMNWKASGHGFTLYKWYYKTQALFQGYNGKGGAWRVWNKSMKKELKREQARDGHWSSPAQLYEAKKYRKIGGHGEHFIADKTKNHSTFRSELDLHIYSTSLCALMLEVYYRYLPTFKIAHESKKEFSDEDDLDINL